MKVAVIGTGYIGISTVLYYLKAGVEVVGIDVSKEKIKSLKRGIMPQKDLLEWLDFDPKPLLKKARFYNDFKVLNREMFDSIFVAVPTEKDGEPYFEALDSVVKQLSIANKHSLVIIESTLMPGVSKKHIAPYLSHFVVAPRRDWFTDKGKTVETLPRIVGGNSGNSTRDAIKILEKICNELHPCHYREAELVKAVENSIRHLGSVYAQELAWGYPDLDIRNIFRLASTKWNVPFYYPNILGTSGYCIPLSTKYVVKASGSRRSLLGIASEAIRSDEVTGGALACKINGLRSKSIGILGVAYLENIKVHILSGALRFLKAFQIVNPFHTQIIKVNDPLYTAKELKKITKCKTFRFMKDLDKFEVLLVTAGHNAYKNCDKKQLIEKTKNCRCIIDNVGIWEDVKFKCPYIVPGRPGWLNKIK